MNDSTRVIREIYYSVKPLIPRRVQIYLRRKYVLHKRSLCKDIWPIDDRAKTPPRGWSGWANKKHFALVLTHDVDTARGQEKCHQLIALERSLGFRSSFNFVPKRYNVSSELRYYLVNNGFEVGIHGLYHDGKLYKSRKIFQQQARLINQYLFEWQCVGFRSPSMQHNLDWVHDLNIEYDASTFDTDPFEPQPDGMGTIFPFFVQDTSSQKGYVGLPYTLPQDFTLFILMQERNIDIWKKKLDWIAKNGGMALLNAHPDYMNFDLQPLKMEEYPVEYYEEFLKYINSKYQGQYWHALPKDVARYFKCGLYEKTDG